MAEVYASSPHLRTRKPIATKSRNVWRTMNGAIAGVGDVIVGVGRGAALTV
jgi:hypothetical protein